MKGVHCTRRVYIYFYIDTIKFEYFSQKTIFNSKFNILSFTVFRVFKIFFLLIFYKLKIINFLLKMKMTFTKYAKQIDKCNQTNENVIERQANCCWYYYYYYHFKFRFWLHFVFNWINSILKAYSELTHTQRCLRCYLIFYFIFGLVYCRFQ